MVFTSLLAAKDQWVKDRDHTNPQPAAILRIEPRREYEERSGWAAFGTERRMESSGKLEKCKIPCFM